MDLDDDGIGTDGDGRARDRTDQALLAGSMRRICYYRQVREFFGERHRSQVKRVARGGFEGFDSALAKGDLIVPSGKQVFGGEQPLFHGGRGAAFEKDRLFYGGKPAQQGEVLHVAGADLEHVGVFADQLHVFSTHDLVTTGRPVSSRASRSIFSASIPKP